MSDAVCLYLVIGGVAIFVETFLVLRSKAIQENVMLRHFIKPLLAHADAHDHAAAGAGVGDAQQHVGPVDSEQQKRVRSVCAALCTYRCRSEPRKAVLVTRSSTLACRCTEQTTAEKETVGSSCA